MVSAGPPASHLRPPVSNLTPEGASQQRNPGRTINGVHSFTQSFLALGSAEVISYGVPLPAKNLPTDIPADRTAQARREPATIPTGNNPPSSVHKATGSSDHLGHWDRWLHYIHLAAHHFPPRTPSTSVAGTDSHFYMALALLLAHSGVRPASPNPSVGCLFTLPTAAPISGHHPAYQDHPDPRVQKIIGVGYTQPYGLAHAERCAYLDATQRGHNLHGSTAYISLEPCVSQGKQPPCCEMLVHAGVKKVIIADIDPDPKVQGAGVKYLRDQGLHVEVGLLKICTRRLLRNYLLHRRRGGRAVIGAKWAQSLDGRYAAPDGRSQWISSPQSLIYSQWLRYMYDAVMVGSGTFIHDRPALSLRHPFMIDPSPQPIKIIFDPHLRALSHPCFKDHLSHLTSVPCEVIWLTSFQSLVPSSLAQQTSIPRHQAMEMINNHSENSRVIPAINLDDPITSLRAFFTGPTGRNLLRGHGMSVLVEGGPRLHSLLLRCGLIDTLHMVMAPKWLGGAHGIDLSASNLFSSRPTAETMSYPQSINASPQYSLINHHAFGPDILIEYAAKDHGLPS